MNTDKAVERNAEKIQIVIPAKAGSSFRHVPNGWIPAFAGMTAYSALPQGIRWPAFCGHSFYRLDPF